MRQTQAEQREAQRQAIRACSDKKLWKYHRWFKSRNWKNKSKVGTTARSKKSYDNMCIQVESAKERKRGNTRNMELYVKM